MLVVRGTKKLRDRVKGPTIVDNDVSTGVLGDWFATALFWRPQVALVVNARTFLPVFIPLAPAPKLLDRLPHEISRVLSLHGVDQATIDAEREQMTDVRLAPTNDRSVLGVMNEYAFLGEHFFEGDLTALSLRMAETPIGPLRSSHRFPDRALAALVAERRRFPRKSPPREPSHTRARREHRRYLQPVDATGVLDAWMNRHGSLDEQLQARFLARPELTILCDLPGSAVLQAITHHRQLDKIVNSAAAFTTLDDVLYESRGVVGFASAFPGVAQVGCSS